MVAWCCGGAAAAIAVADGAADTLVVVMMVMMIMMMMITMVDDGIGSFDCTAACGSSGDFVGSGVVAVVAVLLRQIYHLFCLSAWLLSYLFCLPECPRVCSFLFSSMSSVSILFLLFSINVCLGVLIKYHC